LAAFIAGLLLYWLLLGSKSILAPLLSHAGYNWITQAIKILVGSA